MRACTCCPNLHYQGIYQLQTCKAGRASGTHRRLSQGESSAMAHLMLCCDSCGSTPVSSCPPCVLAPLLTNGSSEQDWACCGGCEHPGCQGRSAGGCKCTRCQEEGPCLKAPPAPGAPAGELWQAPLLLACAHWCSLAAGTGSRVQPQKSSSQEHAAECSTSEVVCYHCCIQQGLCCPQEGSIRPP